MESLAALPDFLEIIQQDQQLWKNKLVFAHAARNTRYVIVLRPPCYLSMQPSLPRWPVGSYILQLWWKCSGKQLSFSEEISGDKGPLLMAAGTGRNSASSEWLGERKGKDCKDSQWAMNACGPESLCVFHLGTHNTYQGQGTQVQPRRWHLFYS